MPRIGSKRHRITIQQKPDSISRDVTGAESFTWENISTAPTMWAEEMPLTGREFMAAGQEQAQAVTKWRIRYRDDITTINRVIEGSRVFDILHIENIAGRDRELILVCKEALT